MHKAVYLAFKTQQFEALHQLTSDLDAISDPVLVQKCAEYFIQNQQFDKAVNLLATTQKVSYIRNAVMFIIINHYFYYDFLLV